MSDSPEPMNILTELSALLTGLDIPFETGAFKGRAPDEYVIIDPLADTFAVYADDTPQNEIQEARLSIYSKGNYIRLRNRLTKALIEEEFTVTDRKYIGYENETEYHHYAIETEKDYEYEMED